MIAHILDVNHGDDPPVGTILPVLDIEQDGTGETVLVDWHGRRWPMLREAVALYNEVPVRTVWDTRWGTF